MKEVYYGYCLQGFLTKMQLVETLFTQNQLTKVGRIQQVVWGFSKSKCCNVAQKLFENYKFSDSNAEHRSLSICRRLCRPKPSLNAKLCRWIVARKFWYLEPLPEKHLLLTQGCSNNFYSCPIMIFFSLSLSVVGLLLVAPACILLLS